MGERHLPQVLHKQVNMVFLSKLGKGRVEVLHTLVMMCAHRLSISLVDTPRRYLLTNTIWTCGSSADARGTCSTPGLEQHLMWARWKGPTPGFNAHAA